MYGPMGESSDERFNAQRMPPELKAVMQKGDPEMELRDTAEVSTKFF
jgi:hypothetical protein